MNCRPTSRSSPNNPVAWHTNVQQLHQRLSRHSRWIRLWPSLLRRNLRPVLQRLRQMMRPDLAVLGQIRDRARELQDAVVGAGGELELAHGGPHEAVGGGVELAVLLDLF